MTIPALWEAALILVFLIKTAITDCSAMEAKPAVQEAVFQVLLLYAMMGFHAQLTTAARGLILLIILEHAQLIQLDADALRTASAMIIIPALMIGAKQI